MVVVVTCKYKEDPIKNGWEKLETLYSLYNYTAQNN